LFLRGIGEASGSAYAKALANKHGVSPGGHALRSFSEGGANERSLKKQSLLKIGKEVFNIAKNNG
jgi:hypothetical protein